MMPRGRERGLTLIEIVAALVVVALASALAVGAIGSALPQQQKLQGLSFARELGRSLLEEVLAKPAVDPDGIDGGETRASFDDVGDYDGYVDAPPTGPTGAAIPGGAGFGRSVEVYAVPNDDPGYPAPGLADPTGAQLFRVEVTVTYPGGGSITLADLEVDGSAVLPKARSAVVYIDDTRSNGNGEHVNFDLKNRTGDPVTIREARVRWSPHVENDFFFGKFTLGSFTVERSPRFAYDEPIPISPLVTLQPGVSYFCEIKDLRFQPVGGAASAHPNTPVYTFAVILTSSSNEVYQLDIPR